MGKEIKINQNNIIEIFSKIREKLDENPMPELGGKFYWKGKWRKINKTNARDFLKEHGYIKQKATTK